MIDVHTEDLFPLSKGPPGLKKPPSPATLWRWALRGIRGHRLETVSIGGRRYSSREAFDRFVRSLNETQVADQPSESELRAKQKTIAAERAASTF
jgi:hypothetical protein